MPRPVDPEVDRAAHEAIQRRQLRGELLDASPLVHSVALENAEALRGFHEALRRLEGGEDETGKVRVAVYGSSNVAGDRWPGYVRGYLQARFGDGGPGFVSLVPLWKWHRHQETTLKVSKGWRVEHALTAGGKGDGLYGLRGVRGTAKGKGSTIELKLRGLSDYAVWWSLWYMARPDGGSMMVGVGGDSTIVRTAGKTGPGYAALRSSIQGAELTLRTTDGGRVELFGVVIERDQSGVVVDQLGIGGSGARRQLEWDEDLWSEHLRERDPALYILGYGGLAAMGDGVTPAKWEQEFDVVVARFRRAVPRASCLIVGPQDLATRTGQGDARARPPALDEVIAAQRRVAQSHDCAFFDTQALMGGPGSMPKWVEARLAMKDHIHFKRDGYAHVGRAVVDAMMAGY